ncbi:hypothetical protein OsI_36070 [Oryza sativa Indica Group]|uniref:protein-serine/threonine phosphatase n=1 Tax=Oryza sativa subsp. indica TaxID=39946 RepID=A2ZE58_ORYSI|nr:hypothetical protein OsI_36070 [Oryza sativa Indica Group]
MEDAVSIRPDFLPGSTSSGKHHFFGVFDGHDCSHQMRVELCAKRSPAAAAAAPAWKDAMEKGFARMDDEATSWAKSSSREEFEQVKDFSICFTNEVGVRAGQAVAPVARARRCHG